MTKKYKIDFNELDLFVDENNFNDWKTFIEQCLYKWECKTYVFDDYVSEMFIVLCKCFNTFNENKKIKFITYLYASMRHKYVELEKKRINHEFNTCDFENDENDEIVYCDSDSHIDIDEIINLLDDDEKQIVKMKLNGMTHREIISTGVVNFPKKLQSIRTKIQKYMEE